MYNMEYNRYQADIISDVLQINQYQLFKQKQREANDQARDLYFKNQLEKVRQNKILPSMRMLSGYSNYLRLGEANDSVEPTVIKQLTEKKISIREFCNQSYKDIAVTDPRSLSFADKRTDEERLNYFLSKPTNQALQKVKGIVQLSFNQKLKKKTNTNTNTTASPFKKQISDEVLNSISHNESQTLSQSFYLNSKLSSIQQFSFDQSTPQLQNLSQNQISDSIQKFLLNPERKSQLEQFLNQEQQLLQQTIYDPRRGLYGSAQPSPKIQQQHRKLLQKKYNDDLDDTFENSIDFDDDLVLQIKNRKLKQLTERCDDTITVNAIDDIVQGVEDAKRKVKVKSVMQLDLEKYKQIQSKIRDFVENDTDIALDLQKLAEMQIQELQTCDALNINTALASQQQSKVKGRVNVQTHKQTRRNVTKQVPSRQVVISKLSTKLDLIQNQIDQTQYNNNEQQNNEQQHQTPIQNNVEQPQQSQDLQEQQNQHKATSSITVSTIDKSQPINQNHKVSNIDICQLFEENVKSTNVHSPMTQKHVQFNQDLNFSDELTKNQTSNTSISKQVQTQVRMNESINFNKLDKAGNSPIFSGSPCPYAKWTMLHNSVQPKKAQEQTQQQIHNTNEHFPIKPEIEVKQPKPTRKLKYSQMTRYSSKHNVSQYKGNIESNQSHESEKQIDLSVIQVGDSQVVNLSRMELFPVIKIKKQKRNESELSRYKTINLQPSSNTTNRQFETLKIQSMNRKLVNELKSAQTSKYEARTQSVIGCFDTQSELLNLLL